MGDTEGARGIELRKGKEKESIRVHFMYRGVKCKETLKLSHTKQNISYAVRLRGEVLNAIERGTFKYHEFFPNSTQAKKFGPVPSKKTVGDALREQLEIAEKTLSPSTYRGYQQVYKSHLEGRWDTTMIPELTAPVLRAWIGTLDCKIKAIRNILTPLRNALEQAVNDVEIPFNPLDRVKRAKIVPREARKSDYEPDPFDMDEITAILAACDGQERNLWQFAFGSGMRTSEFIALCWPSLDWIHMKIKMDRVKVEGVTKEEGKTAAGSRSIDMLQGAHDALVAQQAFTKLAGKKVFHDHRYDAPWGGDHVLRQRWKRLLTKAGVRYRNPYQTRHTFASTLLSAGANPLYVSKMMGHRDTEMVTRKYGRWIELGSSPETRQKALDFFSPVSPKLQDILPAAS